MVKFKLKNTSEVIIVLLLCDYNSPDYFSDPCDWLP